MYGYKCEYCEGTVRPKKVKREAFKHKTGFIILEDIVIGVCDVCGSRYYSADNTPSRARHSDRNEALRENRTDPGGSPIASLNSFLEESRT